MALVSEKHDNFSAKPPTPPQKKVSGMPDPFDILAETKVLGRLFKNYDKKDSQLSMFNNWIYMAMDEQTKLKTMISCGDSDYYDLEITTKAMQFNNFLWLTNYEIKVYNGQTFVLGTIRDSLHVIGWFLGNYKGNLPVPIMIVKQFSMAKTKTGGYIIYGTIRLNPPGVFGPFKSKEKITTKQMRWKVNPMSIMRDFLPQDLDGAQLLREIPENTCAYFINGMLVRTNTQKCVIVDQDLFDNIVLNHFKMHTECPNQVSVVPPNMYRNYNIYDKTLVNTDGHSNDLPQHRIILN